MTFDLNGRRFTLRSNSSGNARVGETVFELEQDGSWVRIRYEGGGVALGSMIGKFIGPARLSVLFVQLTTEGELVGGEGDIAIEREADGGLRFIDDWRFGLNREGTGRAVWIELR